MDEAILSSALTQICDLAEMAWTVDGPVVKIGDPERLKKYELRVYDIRDLLLNTEDEEQCKAATRIYEELKLANVDVLIDERDERPGVKFKDADLIGTPIQVVAGRLASEGKVEVRLRSSKDKQEIELDHATETILAMRRSLYEQLSEKAEAAAVKGVES